MLPVISVSESFSLFPLQKLLSLSNIESTVEFA